MKASGIWSRYAVTAVLGCLAAGLSAAALAGDFSVTPIRIFLDKGRKADVVTVKNDGTEPLRFEIRPKIWSQGPSGEDVYTDTADLLVFPRLMALKAGEDRDIRIGMKIPPGATEKTYRVFITELPPAKREASDQRSANVGFLINFGVPVFFAPLKPAPALEVAGFELTDGRIDARLANTGNVHLFVEEMTVTGFDSSGAEVYRKAISDRYLLAGTSKAYAQDIPAAECAALAVIAYNVRTDQVSANAKKDVGKNSCGSGKPGTPAPGSAR